MASEIYGELELFGICLVVGIVIGFLYDGFRILRLLFVHRDILVDLEDLCFWILTTWLVFRTLFVYNEGALRGYAFMGMIVGFIGYLFTLSRLLIGLIKRIVPYWNRGKELLKKPLRGFLKVSRKTLKNMISDVKMAVRGR